MKRHGVLRDFPRTKTVSTGYHIDRTKSQHNAIFGQLSSVYNVKDRDKSLVASKILLWLAVLTSIIALILSFAKDINVEQPSHIILDLSIQELLLALIAVMFALLKHVFTWQSLQKLKDHLQHMEDGVVYEDEVKIPYTPFQMFSVILMTTWFLSSALLTGGFVLLYHLDNEHYSYLKYTKFSTSIVLFVVVILDGIIIESLEGARTHMKVDICRLIIHELKDELCYELKENGKQQRIVEIEKFIEDNKVFKIQHNDHLKRFAFKPTQFIDCGDINEKQVTETTPLNNGHPIKKDDLSDNDMNEKEKRIKNTFADEKSHENGVGNVGDVENKIRGVPSQESLLKNVEEYVVLEMDDVGEAS